MNNFDFIHEEVTDFGGKVSLESSERMITATIAWSDREPISGKPSHSISGALLQLDMALQLNFVQVESQR